ncbi:hypothetical protein QEH42_gp134 [Microbacterium phage Pumpernickel]|uniref:Cyclic-phosphate processing Receiver domain-containing protein n=1 Tax=Microbacterium phage Pumpernickel TaxID=2885983 RepID=A0AAE9C3N2_9CAUD|nr:hypothetical protein QEH42_gp033 [Microbacterium phage Pumpernickel]YP_010755324.1 hypothetical protein QEH42_gp134 [Microbacterium phage Pumpernickel]UDL15824.1 hypothetical protein SEA_PUMPERNICKEL_33 [Microbacterium phage Pumpernickel]UDL16084.1 hypothetical protein SEA_PUMPERNICKEL_334 [Microbacterium phage Pumpernickel]
MKLFIDDVRPAPEWATHVARTPAEAIGFLEDAVESGETIEHIAFDHDMGSAMGVTIDVRAVVRWMAWHDVFPETASIHTSNPWGRKWLQAELKDVTRIVDEYPET